MTKRSKGDGGLHWDERRQRWIATVTIGYNAQGKRVTRKASARTKTEAKTKLKEMIRDYDDGFAAMSGDYTVGDAVTYWLDYGLGGRETRTVRLYRAFADIHILPALGKRKLRELTVEDVEKLLAEKSTNLGTRSLQILHSILSRAVRHAQVRDKVRRNVVLLCDVPSGRPGRPSKSMTLHQAQAVLAATEKASVRMRAYIVLSLLTGMRTEEVRGLPWSYVVTYVADERAWVPVARAGWQHTEFAVYVWRSVRATGDTKTRKSRRTLAIPQRCVDALRNLWESQREHDSTALVFSTRNGTALTAHNVRRDFRKVVKTAGLNPKEWIPRELRHSFVSLLSDSGVPLESIARLVGHQTTTVTETVYRHQLRPVIEDAASAMDRIFPAADEDQGDDDGRAGVPGPGVT
jgi:integrase